MLLSGVFTMFYLISTKLNGMQNFAKEMFYIVAYLIMNVLRNEGLQYCKKECNVFKYWLKFA